MINTVFFLYWAGFTVTIFAAIALVLLVGWWFDTGLEDWKIRRYCKSFERLDKKYRRMG